MLLSSQAYPIHRITRLSTPPRECHLLTRPNHPMEHRSGNSWARIPSKSLATRIVARKVSLTRYHASTLGSSIPSRPMFVYWMLAMLTRNTSIYWTSIAWSKALRGQNWTRDDENIRSPSKVCLGASRLDPKSQCQHLVHIRSRLALVNKLS